MSDLEKRQGGGYRERIVADLVPVRPLGSPARRAAWLLPAAIALAALTPLAWGPRGDLANASPTLTWGASALQALVGVWLLALGFREAVPGRNVAPGTLGLAAALVTALTVATTLATSVASPTVVPVGREWTDWWECVIGPLSLSAPFALLTTLLAGRAFPTRPALMGGLCGLSAGVLTDAGWRLGCWISAPGHVIGSHGLALLAVAGIGAVLATARDRRRWRGRHGG